MLPEGNWITRAPTLKRKAILLAKVQDEGGHGLYLYAAAETLGTSRDQMIDALHTGKAKYSSIFNYPTLTWADIGVIGWLVDGAAIMNQVPLTRCSYAPYARAMVRICREESFHQRQGFDALLVMMTRGHRRAARDGAGRGEPLVVAEPDDVRPARRREPEQRAEHALGHQAHQQRRAAAEVRRRHASSRPRCSASRCPTRLLKWNEERGHHDFGAIDWDEFWRVVGGHGPCNRERLAARVQGLGRRRLGARGGAGACAQAGDARSRRHDARRRQRRSQAEWPLWEVFVRAKAGLDHKHCGSLHAPDAKMAVQLARDVYTRRQEGTSVWVVRSERHRRQRPGRQGDAASTRWKTRSTATRPSTSCPRPSNHM